MRFLQGKMDKLRGRGDSIETVGGKTNYRDIKTKDALQYIHLIT